MSREFVCFKKKPKTTRLASASISTGKTNNSKQSNNNNNSSSFKNSNKKGAQILNTRISQLALMASVAGQTGVVAGVKNSSASTASSISANGNRKSTTTSDGGVDKPQRTSSSILSKNSILLKKILSIESIFPIGGGHAKQQQQVPNDGGKHLVSGSRTQPRKTKKSSSGDNYNQLLNLNAATATAVAKGRARSTEVVSNNGAKENAPKMHKSASRYSVESKVDLDMIECDDETLRQILVNHYFFLLKFINFSNVFLNNNFIFSISILNILFLLHY